MSSPFGVQSDDKFGKSSQDWDNIDRTKNWEFDSKDDEGNNTVTKIRRFLTNSFAVGKIYIPVIDEIDGETREFSRAVGLPKSDAGFEIPQILKNLRDADLTVKRRLHPGATTNYYSQFNYNTTYYYLAFLREDKNLEIKLCEYGKQIKKELSDIRTKLHPKNTIPIGGEEVPALLDGPLFLYDVYITKIGEKGKSKQYGTSYTCSADPDNPFRGKIPKTVLESGFPANFKWVPNVYSQDEWDLIINFLKEHKISGTLDQYLGQVYKESIVESDSDVMAILDKFNPNATDWEDKPLFENPELFIQEFKRLSGIKLIGSGEAPAGKHLSEKEEKVPDWVTEDDAEDADWEVVSEKQGGAKEKKQESKKEVVKSDEEEWDWAKDA